MRFILSFDVSDDKRRRRVVKRLLRSSHRVQYSVFEGELELSAVLRLWGDVERLIKPETDGLLLVPVCERCQGGRMEAGTNSRVRVEDVVI